MAAESRLLGTLFVLIMGIRRLRTIARQCEGNDLHIAEICTLQKCKIARSRERRPDTSKFTERTAVFSQRKGESRRESRTKVHGRRARERQRHCDEAFQLAWSDGDAAHSDDIGLTIQPKPQTDSTWADSVLANKMRFPYRFPYRAACKRAPSPPLFCTTHRK